MEAETENAESLVEDEGRRVFLPATEAPIARHRKVPSIRELALEDTELAYNEIKRLMLNSPRDEIRLAAAVHILNRGHGHPPKEVKVTSSEAESKKAHQLRRDAIALLGKDPEHVKKVLSIMAVTGMLPGLQLPKDTPEGDVELIEAITPQAEVVVPEPEIKLERPCFCGHGPKDHPAGGACNKCRCQLYTDIDEAEKVREEGHATSEDQAD